MHLLCEAARAAPVDDVGRRVLDDLGGALLARPRRARLPLREAERLQRRDPPVVQPVEVWRVNVVFSNVPPIARKIEDGVAGEEGGVVRLGRRGQRVQVGAQRVAAPHPQQPALLNDRELICASKAFELLLALVGASRLRPERGDVDALTVGAERPAVVEAAQLAPLHRAHRQRRRAVRAHVLEADRLAGRVAVQHDRFAPQPRAEGRVGAERAAEADG
eukprot:3104701-Prymnesium_polylepis.1